MRKGFFHVTRFQVVSSDDGHRPLSREFKTFKGAAHERERFVKRLSQYTKLEQTQIMGITLYTDKRAVVNVNQNQ